MKLTILNKALTGLMAVALWQGCTTTQQQNDKNSDIPQYEGYELVWHDEFDHEGWPGEDWTYETGFVRNQELQYYQAENATVHDGVLDIEGRCDSVANPRYDPEATDWRRQRPTAQYTSASINTRGRQAFRYGRFEVRAKIPAVGGSWPAIWLLGNQYGWPECGEIDIMEYYIKYGAPGILGNACWGGTKANNAQWDEGYVPLSHFEEKDSLWADKFHTWRLDWTPQTLEISVDGELVNTIEIDKTQNQGWNDNHDNPFRSEREGFGAYVLLNLALGSNGGTPEDCQYPLHYLVDYVRVWQPTDAGYECRHIMGDATSDVSE